MQFNLIAVYTLILAVIAVPIGLAFGAWRRDRARLGSVRRGLGRAGLALTTAAWVLFAVFFVRLQIVNQRVGFPENLRDWAMTVALIGFLFATLAVPMNVASIGRTRLLGLLATAFLWLLYVMVFNFV